MRRAGLTALVAVLCACAPARADIQTFGSDLGGPANVVQSHGADTLFYNEAVPGGAPTTAPADGQITAIKVKGGVLDHPYRDAATDPCRPLVSCIHFQVLHPQNPRQMLVELSSGDFHLPITDDKEVVTTYAEPDLVNLCVHKGDIVDLNTIGGFEFAFDNWNGSPLQVFGDTRAGAQGHWYEADNGTNVGTVFDPNATAAKPGEPRGDALPPDTELLMQTVLSTGPDATDICPGGYRQHVFRGAAVLTSPDPVVQTSPRKVRIGIFCHGENYGGCAGTLTLRNVGGDALGFAQFDVPNGVSDGVDVALSKEVVEAIQAFGSFPVTAVADAHDKPDADPRNTGAPPPRPGVQQKTTSADLTLHPDKPLDATPPPPQCTVPKLKGKTLGDAKKALKKAHCKLGSVSKKKTKKPKLVGKVLSQTPGAKSALAASSRVAVTIGKK